MRNIHGESGRWHKRDSKARITRWIYQYSVTHMILITRISSTFANWCQEQRRRATTSPKESVTKTRCLEVLIAAIYPAIWSISHSSNPSYGQSMLTNSPPYSTIVSGASHQAPIPLCTRDHSPTKSHGLDSWPTWVASSPFGVITRRSGLIWYHLRIYSHLGSLAQRRRADMWEPAWYQPWEVPVHSHAHYDR